MGIMSIWVKGTTSAPSGSPRLNWSGPAGKLDELKEIAFSGAGRVFSYGSKERWSRMLRPKMATMVSSRGLHPAVVVRASAAIIHRPISRMDRLRAFAEFGWLLRVQDPPGLLQPLGRRFDVDAVAAVAELRIVDHAGLEVR